MIFVQQEAQPSDPEGVAASVTGERNRAAGTHAELAGRGGSENHLIAGHRQPAFGELRAAPAPVVPPALRFERPPTAAALPRNRWHRAQPGRGGGSRSHQPHYRHPAGASTAQSASTPTVAPAAAARIRPTAAIMADWRSHAHRAQRVQVRDGEGGVPRDGVTDQEHRRQPEGEQRTGFETDDVAVLPGSLGD